MSNPLAESGILAVKPKPWHAHYAAPRTAAAPITREELRKLIDSSKESQSHVLIDLRRNDHEGGTIRGSINLPAQSLHASIPTLYNIFSNAKVQKVVWYCESSKGRGNRAAGWFADYIQEQGNEEMKSLVLLEGIKGWAQSGQEFEALMDEYEAAPWQAQPA